MHWGVVRSRGVRGEAVRRDTVDWAAVRDAVGLTRRWDVVLAENLIYAAHAAC